MGIGFSTLASIGYAGILYESYIISGKGSLLDTGFPTYQQTIQAMDEISAEHSEQTVRFIIGYSTSCKPIYTYGTIPTAYTKEEFLADLQNRMTPVVHKQCAQSEYTGNTQNVHSVGLAGNSDGLNSYEKQSTSSVETSQKLQYGVFYVNGLHHSREPLTIIASARLYHEVATILSNPAKRKPFSQTSLFVTPILNVDGYEIIRASGHKLVRKNSRKTCSANGAYDGVDLNRNYDFNFKNDAGPCDYEVYAGPHPFSEPETQAVRDLIKEFRPKIALNLHSYGNLWLKPYNCCGDLRLPKTAETIYSRFRYFAGLPTLGSSSEAPILGYEAYGEATDWMFASYNVYAMAVELGDEAEEFYPPHTSWDGQIKPFLASAKRLFVLANPWLELSQPYKTTVRLTNIGLQAARDIEVCTQNNCTAVPLIETNESIDLETGVTDIEVSWYSKFACKLNGVFPVAVALCDST